MADEVDRAFPANEHVEIVGGRPVIGRLRAKDSPDGIDRLERLLKERLAPVGILDALADTEHWLGWTRTSDPYPGSRPSSSGRASGTSRPPSATAAASGRPRRRDRLKGLDRRHIAFVNQRHVTEETLDEAITGVIDAYAAIGLHHHWGTGESASADGMKWDVHAQNLMTEYHIRYGGYGGIGYYHVSDTYIALFCRFIACGVWEGHSILDFVAENRSAIQPETVHADTHGQSAPIFGLAYLLGIELMPRIRNWQDLHLFRPDAGAALRAHRRAVHRHDRLAADRDAPARHAARRALDQSRAGCSRPRSCAGSAPTAARTGSTSPSASSAAPSAPPSCCAIIGSLELRRVDPGRDQQERAVQQIRPVGRASAAAGW